MLSNQHVMRLLRRKEGCMINRRRYMGMRKLDEKSYIQDGLVFQLDGINKGSNQGYWTDLKGGCTFTIPASGVNVLDKGFEFDVNSFMALSSGTIPNDMSYTVEASIVTKKIGRMGVFCARTGNKSGDIMITLNGDVSVFMQRQNTVRIAYDINSLLAISYNTNVCCVNGSQGVFNNSDYWTTDKIGMGSFGGFLGNFQGIIHSIRIYNRQLSLAEMQFNQDIDLKRFRA